MTGEKWGRPPCWSGGAMRVRMRGATGVIQQLQAIRKSSQGLFGGPRQSGQGKPQRIGHGMVLDFA